jgi:hypothetical protein
MGSLGLLVSSSSHNFAMIVARPAARYWLFRALHRLASIRYEIQIRPAYQCDWSDLVSTVDMLRNGLLQHPELQLKGAILCDEEEIHRLELLDASLPASLIEASSQQNASHSYFTDTVVMNYLELADKAMWSMLSPGKGIPGWELMRDNSPESYMSATHAKKYVEYNRSVLEILELQPIEGSPSAVSSSAKGVQDRELARVKRPDMRYQVFSCLLQFSFLRYAIKDRILCESDGGDLLETNEIIHSDMLAADPFSVIHIVLCDDKEAAAFAEAGNLPLDDVALRSKWEVRRQYMLSREMMEYLDGAEAAMWMMLGPGRGLPGWAHDSETRK